jgi:hypothetical protein
MADKPIDEQTDQRAEGKKDEKRHMNRKDGITINLPNYN